MSSFVILITVLVGSLIFNGVMFWYLRNLTQRLTFIYQNIGDVSDIIANYQQHLKSVYQMEMFYGDETLQHLLDHTRSISALLEDFEDKEFFLEEFESVEEDALSQEEENNAKTQVQEENVFYAGSRRRDT